MVAAHEARDMLSKLMSKLEEPELHYYSRYGKWIAKHGRSELEDYMFGCLRPEVLTYLQLGNGTVNSLKNIGGNLNFEGRAVYLHGVLGQDRRTRIYVGQSGSLNTRLKQHWNFRYRRDNFSLHYHAVQKSVFDVFAILATLPHPASPGARDLSGMDQPDLLLNVIEMWCCLLFHTLPPQILAEYEITKPASGEGSLDVGLNVAIPLDHGGKSWDYPDLSSSDDPLILEYEKETQRLLYPDYVRVDKVGCATCQKTESSESSSMSTNTPEVLPKVEETQTTPGAIPTTSEEKVVPPQVPATTSTTQELLSKASEIPPTTWFFAGTTVVLGLLLLRRNFGRV